MTAYKIYRYQEPWQLPSSLDVHPGSIIFPQQLNKNLPKQPTIYLGERRKSIYYDRFEDGRYQDPIIKIAYAFKRDEQGLVYEKVRTIAWCLENDKWSTQVQTDFIPVVTETEKLQEIKRRRSNIIDELKGLGKRFGLDKYLIPFFEEYQILVNQYVDSGSRKLRDAVADSNEAWLNAIVPETGNKPKDIFVLYFSI